MNEAWGRRKTKASWFKIYNMIEMNGYDMISRVQTGKKPFDPRIRMQDPSLSKTEIVQPGTWGSTWYGAF